MLKTLDLQHNYDMLHQTLESHDNEYSHSLAMEEMWKLWHLKCLVLQLGQLFGSVGSLETAHVSQSGLFSKQ